MPKPINMLFKAGDKLPPGFSLHNVKMITPSIPDDIRDAVNQKYEVDIAAVSKEIADLKDAVKLADMKQAENKANQNLILTKKDPILAKANDLQKQIDRLQRELEKEQKEIRGIDQEINAHKYRWQELDKIAVKNKNLLASQEAALSALQVRWVDAIKNMKSVILSSMVNSYKIRMANALAQQTPMADYYHDNPSKTLLILLPFTRTHMDEFRKGSASPESACVGKWIYQIVNALHPEIGDMAIRASENYTSLYIRNLDADFLKGIEGEDNVFYISSDAMHQIDPYKFLLIPTSYFREIRETFF